jgi:F-type H+-transporting ATPase subunit epsilon
LSRFLILIDALHIEAERSSRTAAARLRMHAIRRMVEALQGGPSEIGL